MSLALVARTPDVLAVGREAALSSEERDRATRFRWAMDRDDFVAAHLLARICAAELTGWGEPLRLVQRCDSCGGPHGRPTIDGYPDVHVSLSHTRGAVAAAVGFAPVGIDIETFRRRLPTPREAREFLTSDELDAVRAAPDPGLASLRQWVRKESLVKVGATTLDHLASISLACLPVDDDAAAGYVHSSVVGDWCLVDWLDPRMGVVGTVACKDIARVHHGLPSRSLGVTSVQTPDS